MVHYGIQGFLVSYSVSLSSSSYFPPHPTPYLLSACSSITSCIVSNSSYCLLRALIHKPRPAYHHFLLPSPTLHSPTVLPYLHINWGGAALLLSFNCQAFFYISLWSPLPPLKYHPLPPCPAPSYSVSDSLNLCCLNVCGLKSNQHYIRWLLSNLSLDIFAISEHWLHDFDLRLFSSLHNDYKFIANSSPRQEDPIVCAPQPIRGHSSVAIGWHKRLDHLFSPSPIISSHRAVANELRSVLGPVYFVSVYLPSRTDSTDIFRDTLNQLTVALLLPTSASIINMGDFNAYPGIHGRHLSSTALNCQGKILLQFMNRFNLTSAHLHKSNQLFSHTFEGKAHSSVSTIDHILCPLHLLPRIHSAYPPWMTIP